MKPKLTPKQERFCAEYPQDLNATKAAIRAGYSRKTARQMGSENLSKPYILEKITYQQKKALDQAEIKAADVLRELEKVAFSNIKDYLDIKRGRLEIKDLKKLSDEQLAAVAEISETVSQHGGTIRFKLYDKLKALKDLGLRFGIFPTKVEHTREITLAQAIHNAMKDDKE